MGKSKREGQSEGSRLMNLLGGVVIMGLVLYGGIRGFLWIASATLVNDTEPALVVIPSITPMDEVSMVTEEIIMTMIEEVRVALEALDDVEIVSAEAFEASGRIVIQYVMEDDELWLAEQNLKDVVCAVQGLDLEGYGLRIGGNMSNGLTGLTATIDTENLAGIDCSADVVDWAEVANEYSVASGLR